VPNVMENLGA